MSVIKLYTPEVLGLATALADYPLADDLPLRAATRSPLCGSSLEIGLATDEAGKIVRLGMKVHACAIGQAAAALFAQDAAGKDRAGIAQAMADLRDWLEHASSVAPDWPGLSVLAPARDHPARHGAILLAWRGALEALP